MDDADEAFEDYQKLYDRNFYRKLSLKLKDSNNSIVKVDENSLSYIDENWTVMSDHFILPPLPVLLENIRDGCIEITWIVPVTIARIINLMAKSPGCTEFCQRRNIMRIVVDDKVVYDENKAVYDNEKIVNDEEKESDIPIANEIKKVFSTFSFHGLGYPITLL